MKIFLKWWSNVQDKKDWNIIYLLTLCQVPCLRWHCLSTHDDCWHVFLQINGLFEIILESELNVYNKYRTFRDEKDKTRKTLLHYASELGFLLVCKTLVKKYPVLLNLQTGEVREIRTMLPVELALVAENDEVSAYLIRMMWHER